jgi:hypothetical protein
LKDQVKVVRLRTRGLDLEVFLWQGLKDETLGERGSLWCRGLDFSALSSFLSLNGKTASSKGCIELRQDVLQVTCYYGKALPGKP